MSHIKGNIDLTSKGKLYQTKTVSDKNLPTSGNEVTLTIYLNKLIEQYQIKDIENFIEKEKPSSYILSTGINLLLKKYNFEDETFYKILDLLLMSGASPNISINYNSQEKSQIPNINEKDNVTLLMLGILLNDIEFINIILKYNPNINQTDSLGRSAIIYAILYSHNDSTDILNILIKNNANINFALKIQVGQNQYIYHSAFTLACYQDLPRITKCLLDNYADCNFKIKPGGDTGLHICVKYRKENTLKVLLSHERINPDITNNEGKKAIDLIPNNEKRNDIMKLFINCYNQKNNNNNNYNFTQNNSLNINNKINLNENSTNNVEQKQNDINANMNNNMGENYKAYLHNVNSMNNNSILNNNDIGNNIDINLSHDSSYFSDEHENKDKNTNSKKFFNNYNYNNLPKINPIKLLNQKLYNNLFYKSNNCNVEIPIELIKKKNNFSEKYLTLNNFMSPKKNAIPLLNFDVTSKCFELEIKLNDLKTQLQEKNKKDAEYKLKIKEQEQLLEEKNKIFEQSNLDLNNINNTIKENEQKLIKLKEDQKELKNKIPQDKIYQESNKHNKFYKELKFLPRQIEDYEIFQLLNKDLMDYQKYITEIINRKIPLINNLINEIKINLNSITEDYEIKIYGSYANGLCMPWSDIDLVLINKNKNQNQNNNNNSIPPENNENIFLEQNNNNNNNDENLSIPNSDSTQESINPNNPMNPNGLLLHLYYKLKNKPWIKVVNITENLSIKILRILARETYMDISIDISIENEKHNGLKCVNLIKSYLKEYSVLKPITLALKAILQSANLHNPYKGGLSSYGLILMVVSYIQSQKETFGLKDEPNLSGKIFYGFLKHYGILFDFNKYLIVTYPANENNCPNNDKESYLNINQFNQEFIILDPLNNKNNVANSSFQFMNLKMAFMIAFMAAKEDCDCGCHYGKAAYENSFNSTEHSYLKRMLNSVRRFQS
jgi:DNA polymerase sigma